MILSDMQDWLDKLDWMEDVRLIGRLGFRLIELVFTLKNGCFGLIIFNSINSNINYSSTAQLPLQLLHLQRKHIDQCVLEFTHEPP